jgi:predicted O-methyltransferase YrrM
MINLLNPSQEEKDELLRRWWHIYHDKTFRIFTWDTHGEMAWIAEYATRCTNYLEIGCYAGRSAKIALLANPTLKMTILDTWDDEGVFEDCQHNLRKEIAEGRVTLIRGLSQETISQVKDQQFDGCWIDGGHLTPLVEADIRNVLPLMKSGSVMAGHDFRGDNDVAQGVRNVLGNNFYNPIDAVWCSEVP